MQKIVQLKILFALVIFCQSCFIIRSIQEAENPFYKNLTKADFTLYKPSLNIYSDNYSEENLKYYLERGYKVIGYKFIENERHIGEQAAINAGCALGADIMLFNEKYQGSISGNMLIPVYNAGKTYTLETNISTYGKYYSESTYLGQINNNIIAGAGTTSANYSNSTRVKTTISTPATLDYQNKSYRFNYYDYDLVYLVKLNHEKVFKDSQKTKTVKIKKEAPKNIAKVEFDLFPKAALRTSTKNNYQSKKETEGKFGKINSFDAYIWSDFDLNNGHPISKLKYGKKVKILESEIKDGNWLLIEYNKTKGFISKFDVTYNVTSENNFKNVKNDSLEFESKSYRSRFNQNQKKEYDINKPFKQIRNEAIIKKTNN